MSGQSKQRVAIIGAGMVARAHVLSVADLGEELELAGILGRDPDRAAALANDATEQCGYPVGLIADLTMLCRDETIDWVIVLTPPNARREIVTALASAGKSILLEKPIERSLGAASDIVETCESAGVTLGVVFQHRVRAASRDLAALIADGSLGNLGIVEAVVPWWREQCYYDEPGRGTYARDGGGVLISQAIHTLDLMLSLTGPVHEVQAMANTSAFHAMEAEDYVTAGLRFANGAVGSLIASTASFPGDAESIALHFDKCVATLSSGVLQLDWRDGRRETRGAVAGTGGGADPMAFTHEWHRDIISDFAQAQARDAAPVVSGRAALQVHALIDAIIASSTQKCAVTVQIPELST